MFTSIARKNRNSYYRRLLRCEPLEERSLLSVGVAHPMASGVGDAVSHAAEIGVAIPGVSSTARTVAAVRSAEASAAGASDAVNPMVAPTISSVVVVPAQGVITWNALAASGIASSSLTLDGTPVQVLGPFVNPSGGVNFSGQIGNVSVGNHTFTITANDNLGNTAQFTSSFDVTSVGPTISSVVTVPSQGIITWNAQTPGTISSTTLTVDGTPAIQILGPFVNPTGGVNFSGFFGSATTGGHTFTITATDSFGNSSQFNGTFNVLSAGPTISQIAVVPAQGLITWNVQAGSGVASASLSVDGTPVTQLVGPMPTAAGGVNFAGLFGSLPAGGHTFTITATDNLGDSTQSTGSFLVQSTGPTISGVVVVPAQGIITWNVQTPGTLVTNTLAIDGVPVTQVSGPFSSTTGGVNFSGFFGALGTGGHTFSITATDNFGNSSQSTGVFTVVSVGPTISSVVVVPPQGLITWNVQSPTGVANASLSVDGTPVTTVFGPFISASGGVNFSGFFGTRTVGAHTFTITATDTLGRSSQSTGTFVVANVGPTISSVVVVPAQGLMTWNAQAPSGIAASSLTIDGVPVIDVRGPFVSTTGGVNFAGIFGGLSTGIHTYNIFSTDNAGNSSQSTGSFLV
ncbi:MAG: hypothetical protein LLG00_14335 [Planctomycetaceae bacterium]|nr:hypothetical protein [Planctomycetaceae bacterium]